MTEEMLCRCERKVLRRIYGPVKDKGCWHPRWNSGIYDFCNIYDIFKILENITIRRLGWVGHIIRIEDERILRKVFNGKFQITRPL
jgi:hypothetical protein